MNEELQPISQASLLSLIRERLPRPLEEREPADGQLRWTAGEPAAVVVDWNDKDLVVSGFRLEFDACGTPSVRSEELGRLSWQFAPAWTTQRILAELVAAASMLRQASFLNCTRCGRKEPPERMQDRETCRACGERDADVVF